MIKLISVIVPALLILTTGCYPSNYVEITPQQAATNLTVVNRMGDKIEFSDGQIGRTKTPDRFVIGGVYNNVVIKGWGTGEIKRATRVVTEESGLAPMRDASGTLCYINSRADAESMYCPGQ